ncbi:MAG: hypothetical protein SAL70_14325 [Scytonema sp. PMC 1070.18]|nr:hypothetical protein [Scytonema sp. PMC 1070.18]
MLGDITTFPVAGRKISIQRPQKSEAQAISRSINEYRLTVNS